MTGAPLLAENQFGIGHPRLICYIGVVFQHLLAAILTANIGVGRRENIVGVTFVDDTTATTIDDDGWEL